MAKDFDTDQLGTFTGEIERSLEALATARRKCEMAMEITGCDIAISSEGSFGMHPTLIFIPCNEELVMLKDRKNDLEIVGKKLSIDTNFDGQICRGEQDLCAFAKKCGFPEDALILRSNKDSNEFMLKGIQHWDELKNTFQQLIASNAQAFVETDMRSMYNSKRRTVIAEATEIMIIKALNCCKNCGTPGFGVTEMISGLPCELCGAPTPSIKSFIHSCQKCDYTEIQSGTNKPFESPQYCNHCNP
ncbi:MAG: DUF6671 family protein [Chryseolinea sp.]